jgi:multidrug efflux pump subunit AcrB
MSCFKALTSSTSGDSVTKITVKQKKLALIFTVSVIAIGLLAFNNIQRDQFPAVDFELITITTSIPQ